MSRSHWPSKGILALQTAASAGVLALMLWEARAAELWAVLVSCHVGCLLAALLARGVALVIHEIRLWWAIRPSRQVSFPTVLGIGFTASLLNVILPIRAGDLTAVALLVREPDAALPTPVAVAAVGLVAFLEALVFGVVLLVFVVWRAGELVELLGAAPLARATGTLSFAVGAGVIATALATLAGRLLRKQSASNGSKRPFFVLVADTFRHLGAALGTTRQGGLQLLLTAAQILLFVATPVLLLPAAGIGVEDPFFAGLGVLAVSSLAAVVLPPSLGAGPATAAVVVLGAMGVGPSRALAFAVLGWVASSLLPAILGVVPACRRIGMLKVLSGGRADEPASVSATTAPSP
jgi:uncharacterized membrane protein YbhN (UPF0104 family)